VIDQAVDTIARHFNTAAMLQGDALERSDQRRLVEARAVLSDIGSGSLQ
jgi:hypothetical protein